MCLVRKLGARRQATTRYRAAGTSKALQGSRVGDGSQHFDIWAPGQGEDKAESATEILLAFSV